MEESQTFDLLVIGSGPGGYVAAIRATQLKMKVAVIEDKELGGICLNWGCIPAKALLRSAEINHLLKDLTTLGFSADNIGFDIHAIVRRSRSVADKLSSGVKFLLKKNNVQVFNGYARLVDQRRIIVAKSDGTEVSFEANHVLLATGARAREISGLEFDGKLIWSYREAMIPDFLPSSVLIIGSGAIGVEFASFYRDMGVDVILVEMLDRILHAEDTEISTFMRKQFERRGIRIITSATITDVQKGASDVTISVENNGNTESITVDRVISAVGIVGNVENVGLEDAGVKVDRTHVVVDGHGRTNIPGIYAIGDLTGPPWLAHKASHEGVICVEAIAGLNPRPFDNSNIPACTYCRPQVASVGLSENKAKEDGREVTIGRFPLIGNGKAIVLGEKVGFVKTVFDAETGELLGAHMVGPDVTETIQGFAIARTLETTADELMETVFPHPTISEAMHESVLDAYGRALNI
jgi:dihydrolipoamide dehydrogenase